MHHSRFQMPRAGGRKQPWHGNVQGHRFDTPPRRLTLNARQDAPSRYRVGSVARHSALPRERFSPLAQSVHTQTAYLILLESAPQPATAAEEHFCTRSIGRAGKVPCHGSCEHPQALRACSKIKVGPPRHSASSSGCTIAFSDGFETADLKAAKAHLNSLQRRTRCWQGLFSRGGLF
jgi:hypothetical protein